jgi:hypothetical protein
LPCFPIEKILEMEMNKQQQIFLTLTCFPIEIILAMEMNKQQKNLPRQRHSSKKTQSCQNRLFVGKYTYYIYNTIN